MNCVFEVVTYIDDLAGQAFKMVEVLSVDTANQIVKFPYGDFDSYTKPMEQAYLRHPCGCPTVYVETLSEVVECLVATAHSQMRLQRDKDTLKKLTNGISHAHIAAWLIHNLDAVRKAGGVA